ncbi:MAG: hypothetical protein CBB94_00580 [Gammaproteobacteria bacterium TMED34]|nr:MAG: hypothetical protein CBB94_00580 [Gammaproteobacteria bacterium TMED34]
MIKLLKNIFANQNSIGEEQDIKDLELLCGLMIEAAYTDGEIDKNELKKIKSSLIDIFEEKPDQVDSVLNQAIKNKIIPNPFTIIHLLSIKIFLMIKSFYS